MMMMQFSKILCVMLKNGQTHFQDILVYTPQHFLKHVWPFFNTKGKVTEPTNQSKYLLLYQKKCVSSSWAACCSEFVNKTWTYTVSIQSRNLNRMTSSTPVELVTRMIAASQSQTVAQIWWTVPVNINLYHLQEFYNYHTSTIRINL